VEYICKNTLHMKRLLLLFSALSAALLFSNRSSAQVPIVSKVLPKVIIGVKLGANFQELSGSTWDNAYKAGFTGGAFVGVTKKKMGVQVEALVSSAKFSANESANSPSVTFNNLYLNVPVLFEYKLINRLWLQVGPQFSDLVSTNNNDHINNAFKTSDFGGALGLQVILPVHLVASARYILGFTNVNNLPGATGSWDNRSIQLSIGFRFL
jgi:hypothetical protein